MAAWWNFHVIVEKIPRVTFNKIIDSYYHSYLIFLLVSHKIILVYRLTFPIFFLYFMIISLPNFLWYVCGKECCNLSL